MAEFHGAHCPECGSTLEADFIGYFSGIVWYEKELTGWQRLIPFVFSTAHFIIGNWTSTPWIRRREARKCRGCGTLVVPA
jgi:hypothetical protein